MAWLDVFDTFIGLVTIYLVLSLIVTAVGECICTLTGLRGRILRKLIFQLLGKTAGAQFLDRDAIQRLHAPKGNLSFERVKLLRRKTDSGDQEISAGRAPSYIPDHVFSNELLNMLVNPDCNATTNEEQEPAVQISPSSAAVTPVTVGNIDRAIALNRYPVFNEKLKQLWQQANYDLAGFEIGLRDWFNQTGDRSVGWFRRELSLYLFFVGVFVAVALNADTLHMFTKLSEDQALRASYTDRAAELIDAAGDDVVELCGAFGLEDAACSPSAVAQRALPDALPVIGWDQITQTESGQSTLFWILKALGWLLTAAAVSFGAPFWFDILQKITKIRSSIPPDKSGSISSDDTEIPNKPATVSAPAARTVIRSRHYVSGSMANLMGFNVDHLGFSELNQFWCARLSSLAYADAGHIEAELDTWEAIGTLIEDQHTDTQCLFVQTPKAAILAFRGTEQKLNDWLTDLDIEHTSPAWERDADYKIHKGFNDALESVWRQIMQTLEHSGVLKSGTPIWFTGHSLGGALAALGGLRLASELGPKEAQYKIGGVYTFGQPRVGDRKCADALDRAFPNRYFRSINNRDVVPRIPFVCTPDVMSKVTGDGAMASYEYVHAGRVIYFNDTGQALMDPPIWYRKLDIAGVGTTAKAVKDALRQTVVDHGMSTYVQLHKSLLEINKETPSGEPV